MSYLWLVLRHKWHVFWACRRLLHLPLTQALLHDLSKFSLVEWRGYKQRWDHPDDYDVGLYLTAWTHHYRRNPHHWQHWRCQLDARSANHYGKLEGQTFVRRMPLEYMAEMIADWIGANIAYGGGSLSDWLKENLPKMRLHPETLQDVVVTLLVLHDRLDLDALWLLKQVE